jgi:hypothetical protein
MTSSTDPAQAAAEQEYVVRALEEAHLLVAGCDAVVASMYLRPVQYSPLRTRLEHALTRAKAVLAHLRGEPLPRESGP